MSHLLGALIVVVYITISDCFQFDNTFAPKTIYANSTNDNDVIAFRYITGNEDQSKTKIECGYYILEKAKFVVLVQKEGLGLPRKVNPPGDAVANRVTVYTDPRQQNVIGMNLRDIRRTDPVNWRCKGNFVSLGAGSTANSVDSEFKKLIVLDPPTFTDCLRSLSQVNEGNDLRITCLVVGNPIPFLRCDIIDYHGNLVRGQSIPSNIGDNSNGRQLNITTTNGIFRNVQKNADKVRCRAYDSLTGVRYSEAQLTVFHKPNAPRMFSQVASPNRNSIRIRWQKLLQNETGEQLTGYQVSWYVDGKTEADNTTFKRLPPIPDRSNPYYVVDDLDSNFYLYTIQNLARNIKYHVWVQGYNNQGVGDRTSPAVFVAGIDPQSSQSGSSSTDEDLPAIIGGVVGGVIFIILIVILVVWLSRRSTPTKSKYPTSYVEDAIDYPPTQAQQSLYANVNKGNGYSDNYSNGDTKNDYSMRQTSSSYEQSDKAYV